MSWLCFWQRARIKRLFFDERLSPRSQLHLWPHLQRCAKCRALYARTIYLERMMHDEAPVAIPAPAAVLRFSERVVHVAKQNPPPLQSRQLPAIALVLAASLILVVSVRLLVGEQSGFRARSGVAPPLVVRVFCHTRDVSGRALVRSLGDVQDPTAVSECPPGGTLIFGYLAAGAGILSAFYEAADGELHQLTPADGLLVEAAADLTPLPFEIANSLRPERLVVFLTAFALDGVAVADRRRRGATWIDIADELTPDGIWLNLRLRPAQEEVD